MRVDADDGRVATGADRGVESDRDVGGGVVDEHDALVFRGDPARKVGRSIGGGPQGEDQLERAVHLLREYCLDGAPQVAALIEHRHDEGDAGVVRDGGRVFAPGL